MTDATAVQIATDALVVGAKLAGPALVVSLVVGVLVSLIQTVTSVQEMTLTFVPKLIGVGLIIVLGGSWMLAELTGWVEDLWTSIPLIT
ncbi:MAG: flagellar type III secretion system protein FliQ [Actinomycetia bacterium]|nr:flagellar type III secretion system protein FliQ [Actinomycetes bacterium]